MIVLIPKPAWFDELAHDTRLSAREHWFLPDGRHKSYLAAAQPPGPTASTWTESYTGSPS